MQLFRIQKRVGTLVVLFAVLALGSDLFDRLLFKRLTFSQTLFDPSILVVLFSGALFLGCSLWDSKILRLVQALAVFALSAPIIVTSGSTSYFGLWFVVLGTILLYKYQFLEKHLIAKSLSILLWAFFWILMADQVHKDISVAVSFSTLIFIVTNLLMVFVIFEEEIRQLISSNKEQERELEENRALIAQMGPLSALGEKLAHVVHSFKNNLNQISTALFLLETGQDPAKAAVKLRTFSQTMMERIENILMISQASSIRDFEPVDLGRLLDGIRFIYLKEKVFIENAESILDITPDVIVKAIRWDLILMMENLLKNAVEAILEKKIYGRIRIVLTRENLIVENNGGAMPICSSCKENCLECSRFGRIGYTTKKGGSGHGLPQVFQTVKNHDWHLRIRAENDSTAFVITFPPPTKRRMALDTAQNSPAEAD